MAEVSSKEIRHRISRQTLKSRTVDMRYCLERGCWSPVQTPVALRLCNDSRNAVRSLYPLCFGSVLHEPTTVFNFSLDILFFDWTLQSRVSQRLASMTEHEFSHLRSIAFDHLINEAFDTDYACENSVFELFKKAAIRMPALEEFLVYNIGDGSLVDWYGHGFRSGHGPLELFDEFQYEWQQYMYREEIHMDDENGMSECQELPNSDHLTEDLGAPKSRSVSGW